MKEKYTKIVEVAMATAAADGISPNELVSTMGTIMSVPTVLEAVQNELKEKSDIEFEVEEFDFMAWMDALNSVIVDGDDPELVDLNDAYLANASEIIGESLLLNNLCVALSLYFCAQDGISNVEADAIQKVSASLKNIDGEIANLMANSMIQILNEVGDGEE
tara:strand:- start:1239 stop:1724 length:486 start_codon:yes stop_codon:yes gene_type:complete